MTTDLLTGMRSTLGKRYQLTARLGGGGFAEVYRAMDTKYWRPVAIKILRDDLSCWPSERRRFRREFQILRFLQGDGVIRLIDFREPTDLPPYLVVELLHGHSLRWLQVQSGIIAPRLGLRLMLSAAQVLARIHEHGVLHCDIKPDNLWRDDRSGEAIVLDFGIARTLGQSLPLDCHPDDDGFATEGCFGSCQYASPEQILGQPLDQRTDIYSLGATFHELLSGAPAFTNRQALTPEQYRYRVLCHRPVALQLGNDMAARELGPIISRAMARFPADRYQSAGELAADLATLKQAVWPKLSLS